MAEITEYTLAALVSTLLVGGSALTYVTFQKYEASSDAAASLAAIVETAYRAMRDGYSSQTVFLPSSTLSCAGSTLTIAFGNSTLSSPLPETCEFTVGLAAGEHTVAFVSRDSVLIMQVV